MSEAKKAEERDRQFEHMIQVQKVMKRYAKYDHKQKRNSNNSEEEKKSEEDLELDQVKMTAKDIVLNPFMYSTD